MILLDIHDRNVHQFFQTLLKDFSLSVQDFSKVSESEDASLLITDSRNLSQHNCPVFVVEADDGDGGSAAGIPIRLPVRAGRLLDQIKPYLLGYYRDFPQEVQIADFTLFPVRLTLENGKTGTSTRLTEKERDILLFLYKAGKDVTRADLLRGIWGYADGVETHTLETHIYRLRQKIEDDQSNPEILITSGDGYKLIV